MSPGPFYDLSLLLLHGAHTCLMVRVKPQCCTLLNHAFLQRFGAIANAFMQHLLVLLLQLLLFLQQLLPLLLQLLLLLLLPGHLQMLLLFQLFLLEQWLALTPSVLHVGLGAGGVHSRIYIEMTPGDRRRVQKKHAKSA